MEQKPNVPWWSFPAIVYSAVDSDMASNVVGDAKLLKRFLQGQLIPIFSVLFAAVFGALTPGFQYVYTESMIFLVVALAVGLLFPSLGVLFVTVFSVFDLLRFLPDFSLGGLGGRIVSYWLLWLLVVEIPGIVTDYANGARKGQPKLSQSAVFVGALLTGIIVYIWTLGEPLLIRPFFTWVAGQQPTVEAVFTVQVLGYILVIAGVLASLASGFMRTYKEIATAPSPIRAGVVQTIARYVLPVAFVGGVISNFADLLLLIGGVVLAKFLGGQLVGTEAYERSVGKIPRVYRYILAFVITLIFSFVVMQILYNVQAISEFFPHVLVISAGFCIFEFFVGEPSQKKLSTPVVVASLFFFLMMFPLRVAFADNCGGRTDCNGTARGAAAAAAGAGAAAGLGKKGGKGGKKPEREKDAMDKAKEATDWIEKIPGAGHPIPKWIIGKLLDFIYGTSRGISDGMHGE